MAGEASGDMHAAEVIQQIKKLDSTVDAFGFGGPRMKKAGVEIIYDPTELSTIGFLEAVKHLRLMYQKLNQLEEVMKERQPDVVFLVDYSGFNMKVAKRAHKLDIPIVNYFAPSAWVWGQWRANKMAQYEAKIASVFPMEQKVYQEAGAEVEFVGHPLLDMVEAELAPQEFATAFGIDQDQQLIGLLPGSRSQEIDSLLEPMLQAAARISQNQTSQFLLPVAETISKSRLEAQVEEYDLDLKLIPQHSYEVMEIADLLLVASGTATLEAACFGTPMVIAYQTSWTTYLAGKLLVQLPYVGLPNIIADKEIVPELLQTEVTGANLAQEAKEILNSPARQAQIEEDLAEVVVDLGDSGAINRVAQLVLATGGNSRNEAS
ncbi:lipid-A-disaccharide synthase [Halanaerobaculum tunisiense]